MSLLNKEKFLEELPSLNNSILFRETCMILILNIKIKEKNKKKVNRFCLERNYFFQIIYFFYLFLNNPQNKNLSDFYLYIYFFCIFFFIFIFLIGKFSF